MNSETAPPSYSDSPDFPPDYNTGGKLVIGGVALNGPLVRVSHVKAHLCLLRGIYELKAIIEAGEDARIPPEAAALDPLHRWIWFVGLAVERFQRWAATTRALSLPQWIQEEMPPIDVLMVWQAYMLNPQWYAEDCDRLPMLSALSSISGRLLGCLIHVEDINLYVPSDQRLSHWYDQTGTIYDPLDAAASLKYHSMECPQCATEIDIPFITAEGTGYLQEDFVVQCGNCSVVLTRESLAVVKFARDVVIDPHDPEDNARYKLGVYIAGTLRSVKKGNDASTAEFVKDGIRMALPLRKPPTITSKREWEQHIFTATKYSMKTIKAATLSILASKGINVQRVLSAYFDDRPFSANLVPSTVRLSTFADKMHQIQWTEEDHFGEDAEDELVLEHAISRFLDLWTSSLTSLFVPTLDIDLVWHTHQMMGTTYQSNCAKYLHRLLDHCDRIDENSLANCFDFTCRAWRERFGVPYTYCGCPLPGDKIGERLVRLKQRISHSINPTGDLVPLTRPDAILATHASDHNAFPYPGLDQNRRRRIEKLTKRAERDKKKSNSVVHDVAFLHPLSIYSTDGTIPLPYDTSPEYAWIPGGGGSEGYAFVDMAVPYGGYMGNV